MPFSIKAHHRLTTAVQQHRTQCQRENSRVNTMKTSCMLALLPLLCGLALAQDQTTAPPRGVRCPFVDVQSQWLKSAYAAGEDICPVRCCTTFSVLGSSAGCLPDRDFTVYTCCNETHERVSENGKFVCRSPSSLKVVTRPEFSTPEDFPGDQCPKAFYEDYPAGYTEDSFTNDVSELCSGNCFWSTGEVKPPFHYYEYVDCCKDWTKLKTQDGKYVCRCDGRLYRPARSNQLRCRPTTR